jgi:5'-methylthioadenosine phosphorylase
MVCMEGPLFSTRAESHLYRSWGAGLINMSALPEAKLAREAEISYALVCMVTDYDCWREAEEDVDIRMVVENLNHNAENARKLLVAAVADVAALHDESGVRGAAEHALLTARDMIPKKALKRMRFLYPKYFDRPEDEAGGKVGKANAKEKRRNKSREKERKEREAREGRGKEKAGKRRKERERA